MRNLVEIRDISGKLFVGPCPWCYEPITIQKGVMVHAETACRRYVYSSSSDVMEGVWIFLRGFGRA